MTISKEILKLITEGDKEVIGSIVGILLILGVLVFWFFYCF